MQYQAISDEKLVAKVQQLLNDIAQSPATVKR